MDRIDEFLSTIDISPDELKNAKRDLFSKGIENHKEIRDMLYSFRRKKVKYSEIASAYRYDKRIRLVLYKYISYIEEFFRARVVDFFVECSNDEKSEIFIKKKKPYDKIKTVIEAVDEIYALDFKNLTALLEKIPNFESRCKFPPNEHIEQNLKALKALRNAVMHNRFLQFFNSYEHCFYNDVKQPATLRYNIINMMQFLPTEAAQKCKSEINKCKNYRNTQGDVKWTLPKELYIDLDI